MPSYKKIHKLLDSILSGGVDNAPLSTDEIETINMLIDLANRTDNDEVRDLLLTASNRRSETFYSMRSSSPRRSSLGEYATAMT